MACQQFPHNFVIFFGNVDAAQLRWCAVTETRDCWLLFNVSLRSDRLILMDLFNNIHGRVLQKY